MSDLPAPLVPAEVDLRDFGFMPLDVLRLRDSDLAALANGEEFKAAVLLWCAAWHQVPAASLPNDDRLLARYSGTGHAWKKVRAEALRGFVACSDGRLYHATIAEKAHEAWASKQARCARTAAATAAREAKRRAEQEERDAQRNVERNVEREQNRNVVQGTGTGTGTVKGQGYSVSGAGKPRPTRKCPDSFLVTEAMVSWARTEAPGIDIGRETRRFRDHEFSKAHSDWPGTWRNWIREAFDRQSSKPRNGAPVDTAARDAEAMRLLGFGLQQEVPNA